MRFQETELRGAFVIELDGSEDERGSFVRTFCAREFGQKRVMERMAQTSISYSRKRGTLRGIHYQESPHQEAKLITCVSGSIYDVIVDLRPYSPTFKRWIGCKLNSDERRALFAPEGFAHGFQTLVDDTAILYHISEFYEPASARGILWNDPILGITWPLKPTVISPRDRLYPLLKSDID